MKLKIAAVVALSVACSGCAMTLPVRGQSGSGSEVFTGTGSGTIGGETFTFTFG